MSIIHLLQSMKMSNVKEAFKCFKCKKCIAMTIAYDSDCLIKNTHVLKNKRLLCKKCSRYVDYNKLDFPQIIMKRLYCMFPETLVKKTCKLILSRFTDVDVELEGWFYYTDITILNFARELAAGNEIILYFIINDCYICTINYGYKASSRTLGIYNNYNCNITLGELIKQLVNVEHICIIFTRVDDDYFIRTDDDYLKPFDEY